MRTQGCQTLKPQKGFFWTFRIAFLVIADRFEWLDLSGLPGMLELPLWQAHPLRCQKVLVETGGEVRNDSIGYLHSRHESQLCIPQQALGPCCNSPSMDSAVCR